MTQTLFTRFVLFSPSAVELTSEIRNELIELESKEALNISFNEDQTKLKILFTHTGFLLEHSLRLGQLQQALESILSVSLFPIEAHVEDKAHLTEQRAPRFYGRGDIQGLLGVSRQRVNRIMANSALGFPEPVYSQGHTSLWKAKEVDVWVSSYRKNRRSI